MTVKKKENKVIISASEDFVVLQKGDYGDPYGTDECSIQEELESELERMLRHTRASFRSNTYQLGCLTLSRGALVTDSLESQILEVFEVDEFDEGDNFFVTYKARIELNLILEEREDVTLNYTPPRQESCVKITKRKKY